MEPEHKKVFLKMIQIARMRMRGFKDPVIASHFGLSQSGLSRIVATQEYKDIETEVASTLAQKLDEGLVNDHEQLKKKFEKMVPYAMQALLDSVMQTRDLKARLAAAAAIFDRDPSRSFPDASGDKAGTGVSQPLPTGLMSQLDAENKTVVADVPKPRVN